MDGNADGPRHGPTNGRIDGYTLKNSIAQIATEKKERKGGEAITFDFSCEP